MRFYHRSDQKVMESAGTLNKNFCFVPAVLPAWNTMAKNQRCIATRSYNMQVRRTSAIFMVTKHARSNEPSGKFIEIEGRKLHYKIGGETNTNAIILLHGASGSLLDFTFSSQHFEELSKFYRVLAFDRPGLGFSSAAKINFSLQEQARLMREATLALGIYSAVLVGHSYGASVALSWAVAAPSMVQGLVLLSGVVQPFEPMEPYWIYKLVRIPVLGYIVAAAVQVFVTNEYIERVAQAIFEPQQVPDGYIHHVITQRTTNASCYRNNCLQVLHLQREMQILAPKLNSLRVPISVVTGDEDRIVDATKQSKEFARRNSNVYLTILQGSGHMIHHFFPSECLFLPLRSIFDSNNTSTNRSSTT